MNPRHPGLLRIPHRRARAEDALLNPAPRGLLFTLIASISLTAGFAASAVRADEPPSQRMCRPILGPTRTIELGKSGEFHWTCPGEHKGDMGFYIVFIRPTGTYVLLKVPQERYSFEFTPDTPGAWRWIVIHTDPDRSKPDLESDPGTFLVAETRNSN